MNYPHFSWTLATIVRVSGVAVIIGILAWYGYFQARILIAGPSITIDPISTEHQTRSVSVQGIARNVTSVTLNDRPIYTTDEGRFEEQIILENGYTIMTIRASDRYGRQVMLTYPFVYTPAYQPISYEQNYH